MVSEETIFKEKLTIDEDDDNNNDGGQEKLIWPIRTGELLKG